MSQDRLALQCAAEHAFRHLDDLPSAPVAPTARRSELTDSLQKNFPTAGMNADQVIDELVANTRGGITGTQSGRFFSWVMGGGLPAAMAADWLTTVWDQNAGLHAASPAASVIEEVAGAWLREIFELPAGASFAFTTGTQMAHVTCLAAARHAILAARNWDVGQKGLWGAPAIRLLVNADRHASLDRAARLLGFGSDSIEPIPVDADGSMDADELRRGLAQSDLPAIVVLQAGELNLGRFDRFAEIAPIARAAKAWIHVDGAFGLWAKAVPELKDKVRGLELCDSWTTDAHKMLNVPYDSGIAFVRDAPAHRAAMSIATSYLPVGDGARDQIDWTPEFSRRARGFAVYAALRQLGRDGLADLITRLCGHCRSLAQGIAELPGAELAATPELNQALVRFLSPQAGATDGDHDKQTDRVIAGINASGEAMFGGVTWRGKRWMRISVCNWRTTDTDISRAIAAAKTAIAFR